MFLPCGDTNVSVFCFAPGGAGAHSFVNTHVSGISVCSIHVVGGFFVLFLLRFEHMYRFSVFSIHLIHVSFSFVFNTCVRGDVLTLRLVNTHVSVLWLGVKQPFTEFLCRHNG